MDTLESLRTLVVDDDPTTLTLLRALLTKQGLDVTAETDPVRAWHLYEAQPFPLVVLDWMLPGMSGLELCQRIRGASEGARSVIILVTSRESAEDLNEALRAGVDDYFVKPIQAGMLAIRVQMAAHKVQLRSQHLTALHDLRHALERFNLVAQSTSEGLWDARIADPNDILGNEMWYSAQFKRLLGFEEHEFPNTMLAWYERLHPDDAGRVLEALQAHLQRQTPFNLEYRLRNKQDAFRWYRAHGQAVWTAEGRAVRFAGSLQDITEARRSQMKLATRNFELRTLHRLSQLTLRRASLSQTCGLLQDEIAAALGLPAVGIAIYDSAADQLVLDRLLGSNIGAPDATIRVAASQELQSQGALTPATAPEESARLGKLPLFAALSACGLSTIISTPMVVDGRLVGVLILGDRASKIVTPRTLSWAKNIAGHLAGLLDRLVMEGAFRESEARFSQLASHVNHVLWLCDAQLQETIYVNPAYEKVWGRKAADLRAGFRHFFDAIHPDDRERERAALGNLGQQPYDAQFRIVLPDGGLRWVRNRAFPILDEVGRPYRVAGISEDVTERRELETQLFHSQKMQSIGQLAAGIAHEINTPTQYVGDNALFLEEAFTHILGILDSYAGLEQAVTEPANAAAALEAVRATTEAADLAYLKDEIPRAIQQSREGLQRVSEIVRAMKAFSHPGTAAKAPVDINEALRNTITVCRNEWKYHAAMVMELDPDMPLVPCLANEMNQVYLNIIVNAGQAIAESVSKDAEQKGTITVRTGVADGWAEVRIEDTGPGIPEAAQARVFEPFFTTKEVGKGTGQGLAIAHSVVVKKHGGTLTFETAAGKGTTFIIRLPLLDANAATAAPTEPIPVPEPEPVMP